VSKYVSWGLLLVVALVIPVLAVACGGQGPQQQSFTFQFSGDKLDPEVVRVKQGDTVTLKFASSQPGQFHIHGYDRQVEVQAGQTSEVTFIANATGRFAIAYHPHQSHPGQEEHETNVGFLEVSPR